MDAYLAVKAHFIVDFELKSILLHCEHFSGSHTSIALLAALKKIAIEWQIQNKITLAVSDNATNITNALQQTGWPHFGCFLHKLNLAVEKGLKATEFILETVKKIVAHFKKSHIASEDLSKYQTNFKKKAQALRLVQSVPTQWNSVFYMLNRFLQLQVALQAVIPNLRVDLPIVTGEMYA